MPGWKDFQDIAAWQLARALKIRVDGLLEKPEFKRLFRYCDQLSDAARSGPANIAEGFGRHGNKEFARFVRIAKGSEAEVLNHLIDALDQELITESEFRLAEHDARKAMKAAIGLIRHLETPRPDQ
jgi:four helix bundle protein